jgi:hypothetical protein
MINEHVLHETLDSYGNLETQISLVKDNDQIAIHTLSEWTYDHHEIELSNSDLIDVTTGLLDFLISNNLDDVSKLSLVSQKLLELLNKHKESTMTNEIKASTTNLTFGELLPKLKSGKKVAREGWNGKGMFIYYVPENKYPASRNEHGTMLGVFKDDMVPYGAYLAMKTAQNNVVPWLASQTDILAEDWQIVE